MADDRENFVARWSRLKRDSRDRVKTPESPKPASPADAKAPPPDLPSVERLNFDSDYRGFFHPKVDEDTRRAALKKLFSDARFNVIDPLDIDIDDYSKLQPLSAAVAASLKQTQEILAWARERDEAEQRKRQDVDERERLARHDSALPPQSESAEAEREEPAAAGKRAAGIAATTVDPEDAQDLGKA